MGTDFFDDLGETLSKTAREFGERAESIYETQKLRAQIMGEKRAVGKAMEELGKLIYKAYTNGAELPEEQRELCEQIDHHKETIGRYKAEMAGKKGKKLCPACGEGVDKFVAYCPYCGAACPNPEPEENAGDVVAEVNMEESAAEEASAEGSAPGFQDEPVQEDAEQKETVQVEAEPEKEPAGEDA